MVDLPGAVGPEQADARPLGNVEVEPVHGGDRAVALDGAAQADGQVAHPSSLPVGTRPATDDHVGWAKQLTRP